MRRGPAGPAPLNPLSIPSREGSLANAITQAAPTLLTLALLAAASAASVDTAGKGADEGLALAAGLKEEAAADAAALGAALAARLKGKVVGGATAPGYVPGTTIPLTLVSAANGSSTLKCGRNRQCIDQSGPDTFGAVAAVTPTLTLSTSTPWTDAASHSLVLADIPYVPGARPATAIDPRGSLLTITAEGGHRVLRGNGLPTTPIGNFPVSNDTDAYPYYAALPAGTDPATGQAYQPDGTANEIYVAPYNLTSSLPLHPKAAGAFPVDSLIVGVALTGAVWHAESACVRVFVFVCVGGEGVRQRRRRAPPQTISQPSSSLIIISHLHLSHAHNSGARRGRHLLQPHQRPPHGRLLGPPLRQPDPLPRLLLGVHAGGACRCALAPAGLGAGRVWHLRPPGRGW